MAAFLKRRRKLIIAAAAAAVAILVCGILYFSRQTIIIDLNTENLSYVVCSSRGLGPRRLDYSEHQAVLDELFGAVSGEYRYVRGQSNWFSHSDGCGPYSLSLYDGGGELIDTIYYLNGQIYVPAIGPGRYNIYQKNGGSADFAVLEDCLDLYGTYR